MTDQSETSGKPAPYARPEPMTKEEQKARGLKRPDSLIPAAPVDGPRLRRWRLNCGWTQQTASIQLGISVQTYCRYEHDRQPIPLAIWRACKLLYLATPAGARAIEKNFPDAKGLPRWLKTFAIALP